MGGAGAKTAAMGVAALALAVLGWLAAPASANAGSGPVRLAGGPSGWELLASVGLPLEVSGSSVNGRIVVKLPRGHWSSRWKFDSHSGPLRLTDRRNQFRFVKGIRVPKRVARALRRNPRKTSVRLKVNYRLPTTSLSAGPLRSFTTRQARVPRAGAGFCESLPLVTIDPSRKATRRLPLPTCGRSLRWRVVEGPQKGRLQRKGNAFHFQATGRAGADELVIGGYLRGRLVTRERIQLRLVPSDPSKVSVVALGDSVTAGFGYFGATGRQMGITQLLRCKPAAVVFNDACSSNSYNRNSSVGSEPDYLPDFGLSRNISWAAKWANEYGITDYRNYAVTGSAPTDWLPGGQFDHTRETVEKLDPDYILMTMGANPLLSDVLFGIDNMGCALESDLFGDFRQCVLDAFESVDLDGNLNSLYTSLVNNTSSRIVLMGYHLAVPSSALAYTSAQLEMMTTLLNEVIASEAGSVSTERITFVTPPRFDVGIDMRPLYPANFTCSFFGFGVDGPSVQSSVTQAELLINHPFSFCRGPAIGPPWIISGDTGIHPSAAGYLEMASNIPAPGS